MWCTAQRKGRPLLPPSECYWLSPVGGFKIRSPDYVSGCGRDRSLQRRFPIVDILFRSGDIRDQSAKSSEIVPKIANYDLSRVCGYNLVNFGPQTAKNRTVVWRLLNAKFVFYPPKMLEPRKSLWGCVSKSWSFSTVCENLRRKRPLTAEKSFSKKVDFQCI